MIKLTPLGIRNPHDANIYTPSRLFNWPKRVSIDEFRDYTASTISVSFDPDGISNPQKVTAYSKGMGRYYLAEF